MGILLLSGPIGAGKTTVGRVLRAAAPRGTAYIEGDVFWTFLLSPKPGQLRHEGFAMTMRAMLAAARHYHRDAYEVIVDFSVPVAYLPAAKKLLGDVPFSYVVLSPPEAVCAERAATRSEGAIADYAQYHDFYREFAAEERCMLRDAALSPEESAARIRAGVAAGTFLIT